MYLLHIIVDCIHHIIVECVCNIYTQFKNELGTRFKIAYPKPKPKPDLSYMWVLKFRPEPTLNANKPYPTF